MSIVENVEIRTWNSLEGDVTQFAALESLSHYFSPLGGVQTLGYLLLEYAKERARMNGISEESINKAQQLGLEQAAAQYDHTTRNVKEVARLVELNNLLIDLVFKNRL